MKPCPVIHLMLFIGTSYWQSQTVLPVKPGQYYTFLGYLKTNNIVAGTGGGGAWIHYYFYDASGHYVNDYATTRVTQTSGWTKYVMAFTPPANSATVTVRLELANAQGTAVFDNIRLNPGNLAVTNAYDLNKNYVTSTTDQLQNTVNLQNDAYGQSTQVTVPSGAITKYSYDGQERLRTVTDNVPQLTTWMPMVMF